MSEVTLSLYQKIRSVMQDVEYLKKDDQVKFKEINYKAISEEKVTSTIRQSLVKHGLVILPVEQEHLKEGTLTTVNTKYKIIDVDTGQFEIIASSGTGVDTQDKGVGKAMTYSYKYLMLRTFAIPTGEDPDKISSAEWDEKEKPQADAITPTTVGLIKAAWLEKGYKSNALNIQIKKLFDVSDITKLTEDQGNEFLEKLNQIEGATA